MRYSHVSVILAVSGGSLVSAASMSTSTTKLSTTSSASTISPISSASSMSPISSTSTMLTSSSASKMSTSSSAAKSSTASSAAPVFTSALALPMTAFDTPKFVTPISLDQILAGIGKPLEQLTSILGGILKRETPMARDVAVEPTNDSETPAHKLNARAQCASPVVRQEWDSYSTTDRRAFTDAIRCLMTKPRSGAFAAATTRYEDMVALHQTRTPTVHGNHIFLLWHRYYLWTFEQLLRSECGFNRQLPWFDETKYSGRFSQSSVFSSDNFGAVGLGGKCVTDGQFANLAINVGPGSGNTRHCLARNGNADLTANTNSQMVNGCNAYTTFATMAYCAERGAHAYGHNGIGAVMLDVYASPSDPVFWLHHAFIDRNFRVWQNSVASRKTTVDGTDNNGNPLTLNTVINVGGIRPDVRIGDVLDTTTTTLCYKYNY